MEGIKDNYNNMQSSSVTSSLNSSLNPPISFETLDEWQSTTMSVDSWAVIDDVLSIPLALMISNEGFRLDETLTSVMKWKFVISSSLSAYCVVGNLLLVTFLLSTEEYRKWHFFPILFQALTDLIGAGISNAVYEWKFLKYWPKRITFYIEFFTTNFIPLGDLMRVFAPPGIKFCVLNHLRQLLNDFSTGLCVVTTAYYRYIFVCHPTYDLTDSFCLKMALGIVMVIVLAFVGNTLDLVFNYSYHTSKFSEKRFGHEEYLFRCSALISKYLTRNAVEFLFLFLVPALAAGFFYARVVQNLWKQERRVARNRALSLTFIFSWALWILCWTPNYLVGFLEVTGRDGHFSFGGHWDSFLGYMFCLKLNIQMLYSHINVLVYVVQLQKFQDYHLMVFGKVRRVLCLEPKESEVSTDEEEPDTPVSKNNVGEDHNRVHKQDTIYPKMRIISLLATITLLSFVTVSTLFLSTDLQLTSKSQLRETMRSREILTKSFGSFLKQRVDLMELLEMKHLEEAKLLCARQRGTFKFHQRKCFFLNDHGINGLNKSEQLQYCRERGAILTYPRSKEEIRVIWQLLETKLPAETFAKTIIHLGLEKSQDSYDTFLSVDGKVELAQSVQTSMFVRGEGRRALAITGAAVCLTKLEYLSACMPRDHFRYSICSKDLQ